MSGNLLATAHDGMLSNFNRFTWEIFEILWKKIHYGEIPWKIMFFKFEIIQKSRRNFKRTKENDHKNA